MSQVVQEDLEVGGRPKHMMDTDGHHNPPHFPSVWYPISEEVLSFGATNGPAPLFSMFVKMAEEEDNKVAERRKGDVEGILIFSFLFSATVAASFAVSVQNLRLNPQDTSAFHLSEDIYRFHANDEAEMSIWLLRQLLVNLNAPPAAEPSIFTAPRYMVWVNLLWYLSLVISYTCTLLTMLLLQWVRRYTTIMQLSRRGPRKRALIRVFFAGVDKPPRVVETLPILLHLSVFLFFAGLLIYLFNINHTIFSFVASWVGISAGIYALITSIPLFHYTLLSLSVWVLYAGLQYTALESCRLIRWAVVLGSGVKVAVQPLHVQTNQTSMDLQFPQSMVTFQSRIRTSSNSSAFSSPENSSASVYSESEVYGPPSEDEEIRMRRDRHRVISCV